MESCLEPCTTLHLSTETPGQGQKATKRQICCARCDHPIGARRIRYQITDTGRVLCGGCVALGQLAHEDEFPRCPHTWHDLHDHDLQLCTRAAAAVLGMSREQGAHR